MTALSAINMEMKPMASVEGWDGDDESKLSRLGGDVGVKVGFFAEVLSESGDGGIVPLPAGTGTVSAISGTGDNTGVIVSLPFTPPVVSSIVSFAGVKKVESRGGATIVGYMENAIVGIVDGANVGASVGIGCTSSEGRITKTKTAIPAMPMTERSVHASEMGSR